MKRNWAAILGNRSARENRDLQNFVNKEVYNDTRGLEDERTVLADSLTELANQNDYLEELLRKNGIEFNVK